MRLALFIVIFITTSCSTYHSDFSCNKSKGMGCMSLSNINKAVNEKDIRNLNPVKNYFLPRTDKVYIVFGEYTEGGKRSITMEVNGD